MPLKQQHLLMDTMVRCHRNILAEDIEEITSLPLTSALQTSPKSKLPSKGVEHRNDELIWNFSCDGSKPIREYMTYHRVVV